MPSTISIRNTGRVVVQSGTLRLASGVSAGCVIPTNYVADVLADSPEGYWQLNDVGGGGGTVVDSSGNGRDGIIVDVGDPLYQDPGPFGIGDCCMNFEPAGAGTSYIRFDTTDFDSIIGVPSQEFTMEIWSRQPVSLSGTPDAIFDKTDTSPANWNTMQVLTDGRANVQLYDGTNNPSINTVGTVEANGFHHFVLVREISTPRILFYLDGSLVGTSPVAASVDTSNTTKLTIGAREAGADRHINNSVAHAAVYSTALSSTRILSHYNTGTMNP